MLTECCRCKPSLKKLVLQACLFYYGYSAALQGVSNEESIELLQIGLHLQGMEKTKDDSGQDINTHTHTPSSEGSELHDPATDYLHESSGLYWLHVPKCGVSFINVFLNDLGLCPKAVAEGRCFNESDYADPVDPLKFHMDPLLSEMKHDGLCHPGALAPDFTDDHTGIGRYSHGPQRLAMQGRVVVMLRQPEQRLISAYNAAPGPHGWRVDPLPRDLREYAEGMQGCAVKMFTQTLPCSKTHWQLPSWQDVAVAKGMLSDVVRFVGLTDEWELSVCLFHAIFGGRASQCELGNVHRGPKATSSGYNVTELGGFRDVYDGALYEEASRIFKSNLKTYKVTLKSCRR